MTDVTVRPATLADLDDWIECGTGLFAEDAGQRDRTMNLQWPKQYGGDSFRRGLADDSRLQLVAAVDGAVAGTLAGSVTEPGAMRLVRVAELVSMFVRPESRGRGIGAELVSGFKVWATSKQAERIAVTAYAANEDAIRFYRRMGFSPYHVGLEASLR